jgi:group II intron reverse transcriptase/maturase
MSGIACPPAAGSYLPQSVKRVQIEKRDGGKRPLDIPTVSDRIAQAVVKGYLEPELEKHFHPDSYGYQPGKSALDAVGVARQRCWMYAWALDIDIRAFFDLISHKLLFRAVRKHTDCAWVLLYIERWLKASVQLEDGTLEPRQKGSPQGSVIWPLLAKVEAHCDREALRGVRAQAEPSEFGYCVLRHEQAVGRGSPRFRPQRPTRNTICRDDVRQMNVGPMLEKPSAFADHVLF